jgi:hypothetical protein
MTNDPRNPLPGEQPGSPQEPGPGMGLPSERMAGQQPSGQRPRDMGQTQPPQRSATEPAGATPTGSTGASASSSEEERVYQPQQERAYERTARTAEPARPRRSNRKLALAGILGLAAIAGIITGFAATNNQAPTVAAVHVPRHIHYSPSATHSAPAATGHLITTFNSVGNKTSSTFTIPGNPTTVHYGFKCATGTATFKATMAEASGGNKQTIANTGGTGISRLTSVPTTPGAAYRISADSVCPYSIKVYGK